MLEAALLNCSARLYFPLAGNIGTTSFKIKKAKFCESLQTSNFPKFITVIPNLHCSLTYPLPHRISLPLFQPGGDFTFERTVQDGGADIVHQLD